jgi:ribonuclease T2
MLSILRTWRVAAAAAVIAGLAASQPVIAQRGPLPDRAPREAGPGTGGGLPGKFDYYAMVLSWSPSYCAGLVRNDYDPQCHRRDGKRYAFVLHGLWPQYDHGWPEYCPTRDRPFVPQSVIDRMTDIMPNPRLTIHEYRKHGTCSGLDPAGYYDLSRSLFAKVRIPLRYHDLQAPLVVTPGEIVQDFLTANPALKPDMIAIACEPRSGSRLKEIRVCFSKQGEFRACGRNEDQRRLCSTDKTYLPPVRLGAGDEPGTPGRYGPRGQRPL